MKQTKLESLLESLINIAIGYTVSIISQIVILPFFGIDVTIGTNMVIGLWFTVVSIIRSYTIRRFFNARIQRAASRVLKK